MRRLIIFLVIALIIIFGFFAITRWGSSSEPETLSPPSLEDIAATKRAAESAAPATEISTTTTLTQTSTLLTEATSMKKAVSKHYEATLHTTLGDIVIAFSPTSTPATVNNFVTLAKKNFYDATIFHRVIKGFMIQGGDPEGTGRGGPGYKFADEPFEGEYTRGTVAMANSGPNTNGSQFFIMHADYPLPKNYVIFGHVVKGLDVVDAIANEPMVNDGYENSKPVKPVVVKSVTIQEK